MKEKLKLLKDAQPPGDKKDELIKHLTTRLAQTEQAITAAEEVITHERNNRKQLFKQIEKSNADLRQLVDNEKKHLSERVQAELEKTLQ